MTYEEARQWSESQDFYQEVLGMNESYRRLLALPIVVLHAMPDAGLEIKDTYVEAVTKYQKALTAVREES